MSTTVNQPGIAPTRKMTAVGITGAVSIVLILIAGWVGVPLSEEGAGAIATLLMLVAGYFVKESAGNAGEHREAQPPPSKPARELEAEGPHYGPDAGTEDGDVSLNDDDWPRGSRF